MFAGVTSALGIPRAARAWRGQHASATAILPLVTHLIMTTWFFAAGSWAMFAHACSS